MGSETFDDILDQCLAMADAGATIDDCVAPYPQFADELRSHLELITMIREAGRDVPANLPGQATGRVRLLAAVGEKANEGSSSPALGIFVPMQWAFAYAGRLALPRALPAALVILLLTGTTLGALAATDTGGFRSAVTDAIRSGSSDDDDVVDDGEGPLPDGDGGGGDASDDPALPGGLDVPEATGTPPQPTDTPMNPTDTPADPAKTPSAPTDTPADPVQTPSAPTDTPAGPTHTPDNPTQTPSNPTDTAADPTQTPANPTHTPADPTHTPSGPPDVLADIADADAATGEEDELTDPAAGTDGTEQSHSADLPAGPA